MKKILNLEYGAIHAFYWMSYAVIGSFASAFLLGRGYSNSFIGLIIAVGSVLAIFLQPVLADIADRSKKISLFGLTEMVSALMIILTFISFVLIQVKRLFRGGLLRARRDGGGEGQHHDGRK